MKYALLGSLLLAASLTASADNLTESDRIEILRGLTAEYATVKVPLPRVPKSSRSGCAP